ncbi:MAG: hypothetical protein NTY33_03060 [Candidatus Moranbacteria bacterium]|nr:hypothetical protein [Candidatus Moranbacteria bacterium]
MKIKILLAPALIVIIITLLIWVVYPSYTNGVDGVKEEYQKFNEQKLLSSNLDDQIVSVGKLAADLKTNAAQDAVTLEYIPNKKEEEKIIENLDQLTRDSALSVLNISVSEVKKEEVVPEIVAPAVPLGAALPGASSGVVVTPVPLATTKAVPEKMRVELSVLGDYGGIKILLEKIEKIKMFSKFSGVEIKTLLKEDQTLSDSLSAKITLEFRYLKELNNLVEGDISNPIFSTGTFDRKIEDDIKNKKSINITDVVPGQKGIVNPFIMAK